MLRRRLLPAAARMVRAAAPSGSAAAVASATSPIVTAATTFGAASLLGFGISMVTGVHYHLDLVGTGVFTVVALGTTGVHMRQRTSAFAVALWATKLTSFLFYRALQVKHYGRLTEPLSSTSGTFGFWFITFLWNVLVALPHTLAAGVPLASRPPFGVASDFVGLGLFALGLLIETTADYQKWTFKHDAANAGKFCDVGVWQMSQHPNWLGNIVLWTGISVLNLPTLLAAGHAHAISALAAPVFLILLFYGEATDVIGKAAELSQSKYGADPNFKRYVATTPLVMPTPASISRLLGE